MTDKNLPLENVDGKLSLVMPGMMPFCVDFLSGPMQARARACLHEQVVKACKAKKGPKILDISAGLGRDAYLLAKAGAKVLMLERHPIVASLLDDGLKRLKMVEPAISLDFIHTDSHDYLLALDEESYPDVIYFDPMHPSRKKSSKVKKDLQLLQILLGEDLDKQEIAELALTKCQKCLVIKWPRKAPPLLESVAYSYGDKAKSTVRFDVSTPVLS